MSDFEYLRNVSLGQYIPTGSLLHQLDPRTRLAAAFFLLAAFTLTPRLEGLLVGIAVVLFLLVLARIPIGFALRSLLPPLPFLLFLVVLQVLFPPRSVPGDVLLQWNWFKITMVGILGGIRLLLRFSGLILTLSLSSFVISTSEMTRGLEALLNPLNRFGVPTRDFVMAVQVMLRFIPFLAQSAERIAKAQASRGADWGTRRGNPVSRVRQTFPLLVPLFLNGLRRAENLALAMEARGYGSPGKHTSMLRMHFRAIDALALLLAGGVAAGIWLL